MRWTVRGWRRLPLLIGLALVVGMLTAAPAWAVETRQGDRIEVGPGEVVNDDLYAFGNTVTAYLISAAYLAPVVVALAGGRLLLRTGQTDRRAGAILALAAGLLIYVVLSAIPIVDTLTGLLVVLLGVGAVSGWLWKAIRPGNIATAEPSANGSVAEESVPDRQLMKD